MSDVNYVSFLKKKQLEHINNRQHGKVGFAVNGPRSQVWSIALVTPFWVPQYT